MNSPYKPPPRSLVRKLLHACDGVWRGVRGQSSFAVHAIATPLVIAAGVLLQVERLEWCLLTLCIGAVLSAEMFNSSLEAIARAASIEFNEHLKHGLNMASGAVLMVAVTAVVAGALILGYRLMLLLGYW